MKIILDEDLFEGGSNSLEYGKSKKTAKGSIINSEPFNEWSWILNKKFEVVSLQKIGKINHFDIDNCYYDPLPCRRYFIDCDIDTVAEHITVKVDDNLINFANVPCKIDGLEFQYRGRDYLSESNIIEIIKDKPFETLIVYKIPVTSFDGLLSDFDTSPIPKIPNNHSKAYCAYSENDYWSRFGPGGTLLPFRIKITDPEVIDYINNVIKSK